MHSLELKHTFDSSNGGHTSDVEALVLLENGYLASGSNDNSIIIWELKNFSIYK